MEHLSAESLARLVDEAPTEAEEIHLRDCAACRAELVALVEQTEGLARLTALRPALDDWATLEARLVSEGLIRNRFGGGVGNGLAVTPAWMRAAAALLIFVGGSAFGAGVARRSGSSAEADALGPLFASIASETRTSQQAGDLVQITERQYMDALLRYRQLVEVEGGDALVADPASRFAALEYLVAAGQAALRQAPADPFLNGVLASAMAERQAVLRRISTGSADNWFLSTSAISGRSRGRTQVILLGCLGGHHAAGHPPPPDALGTGRFRGTLGRLEAPGGLGRLLLPAARSREGWFQARDSCGGGDRRPPRQPRCRRRVPGR